MSKSLILKHLRQYPISSVCSRKIRLLSVKASSFSICSLSTISAHLQMMNVRSERRNQGSATDVSKKIVATIFSLVLASCTPDHSITHGYVEGEYLYIAPTTSGILKSLDVMRGQNIEKGVSLFKLDDTSLAAKIATAEADIAKAQAQVNNLLTGQRPEEIAVLLKQKEEAEANLQNSESEFERVQDLVKMGGISQSEFDKRATAYKAAKANLDKLEAQIKVANLSAREEEIAVAQAALEMSKQNLVQARKELQDSRPVAPADGYVEETFYRVGEFVPAGRAVVSLLPPENVKIRFFVSQQQLAGIERDQIVVVNCDGCANAIKAKISFVSSRAEYTPPVIYSMEARQKLVYMIEAIPETGDHGLKPGLPVDIRLEAR